MFMRMICKNVGVKNDVGSDDGIMSASSSGKKRSAADAFSRAKNNNSTMAGRGSLSGWTSCPLCTMANNKKQVKKFALGRGIAAHLHTVHTPWKPGKAEIKRRERIQRRQEPRTINSNDEHPNNNKQIYYDPSPEEMVAWNNQVEQIIIDLELQHTQKQKQENLEQPIKRHRMQGNESSQQQHSQVAMVAAGLDRNGKPSSSYKDSLPPILMAAQKGDLNLLTELLQVNNNQQSLLSRLDIRDRNGSTAEHWAAGAGHLECLKFLVETRQRIVIAQDKESLSLPNPSVHKKINCNDDSLPSSDKSFHQKNKKIRKRRDGKTSLHYAARNGHNECIDYILSSTSLATVDIVSGDGTTPLHMACYGGHLSTIRLLIEKYHANIHHVNDWGCGVTHWIAMTINTNTENIQNTLSYCLSNNNYKLDFSISQKQGHTPLHKAAQKLNRHVIQYLHEHIIDPSKRRKMGLPDKGNNRPSDIWESVGGDPDFAKWMKEKCGW